MTTADSNQMRDASPAPVRKGVTCASCGTFRLIAIEGLFSTPPSVHRSGSAQPACRQAAWRRRRAGVAEDVPRQTTGGRSRNLRAGAGARAARAVEVGASAAHLGTAVRPFGELLSAYLEKCCSPAHEENSCWSVETKPGPPEGTWSNLVKRSGLAATLAAKGPDVSRHRSTTGWQVGVAGVLDLRDRGMVCQPESRPDGPSACLWDMRGSGHLELVRTERAHY